jgi:hypothetical protein
MSMPLALASIGTGKIFVERTVDRMKSGLSHEIFELDVYAFSRHGRLPLSACRRQKRDRQCVPRDSFLQSRGFIVLFLGFAHDSAISVELASVRSLPEQQEDPRQLKKCTESIF